MAINGIHTLLYSSEPEALRALLGDVLGLGHVDAGGPEDGWLIFKLPPAEMGVHPSEGPAQEISLMCEDLAGTIEELKAKGVVCTAAQHRNLRSLARADQVRWNRPGSTSVASPRVNMRSTCMSADRSSTALTKPSETCGR